ncbi:MAG: TonB-dependent receptor [Deltaproteobacteria bacterium]|nr:MAG: TonB-dependent receptor [Deltaproteobacteria bacterium]
MKRYLFSVGTIIFGVVCFCLFNTGEAAEPPVLEQIVVTASRVKEKKKEVTANVTVIDEGEIKNSSAKDLGELLAEKGIGHIYKYPGSLSSVGIRGFRTDFLGRVLESKVLVLVDGRSAGTVNLSAISTKNVERVEIIRGPASVQYGSRAVGGVINIITKRGRGKPSAFVEGLLGSYRYEEGTVGFSGKHKWIDFSGAFSKNHMRDYDTADGVKYHNTGYDSKTSSSLNVGVEFLPGHRLGVIYHAFDADKVGSPNYLSNNDLDDYVEWRDESVDLLYEGKTSSGLASWILRYFSGETKYKYVDPSFSYEFNRDSDQKGAQIQGSLRINNIDVTAGFDWEKFKLKSLYSPKDSEYNNPAFFLLGKTKLLNQRLILTGGIRYDDYEVKVREGEGSKEDETNVAPRVGVAYIVTKNLRVRANYGEAFRMPTPENLAADFTSSWGTHFVGNPDLDPEKSKTYEVGADFGYQSLSLALTYFYTKFKDKIQNSFTPSGDTTWENVGEATISGVEAYFSVDVGDLFDWPLEVRPYASIVYLTKYEDEKTHDDLIYTSDANLSYGVTVSDGEGFTANINFAYVGEQKIEDYESGLYPVPVIKKGGFTVANLTLTKPILDFQKLGKVSLRGEIRNLFNKDYSYVKGYPMPGRSFFLTARYDF